MARMAVNEILGADVETGGVFDPLLLAKVGGARMKSSHRLSTKHTFQPVPHQHPQCTPQDEGQLYRYRAVELKHGRLAMLAVLGNFVAELWHPLYDGKVTPGLKALGELPTAAWLQIVAAIAVVELTIGKQDTENKVRCMRLVDLCGSGSD